MYKEDYKILEWIVNTYNKSTGMVKEKKTMCKLYIETFKSLAKNVNVYVQENSIREKKIL